MKTYKYIKIGALCIMNCALCTITVGCTDSFLDVDPATSTTTSNFYTTEENAESALIGCYNGWKRTQSSDTWGFYVVSELMSDDCFAGTGVTDATNYAVVDRFDQGQYAAGTSLLESAWDAYYVCIYRCNALLHYDAEGTIEWTSDDNRARCLGEARALRALCYFDMVRMWENVPLITDPTEDSNAPQADPDDVYALIVDDLKYAAENIPANAYPKSNMALNDGRVTRYAAEGILARVYLFYTGYYGKDLANLTKSEVVSYLDDIISSHEYALVDNFADLWPAASSVSMPDSEQWDPERTTYKELNSEVILQMKFNYTDNRYNDSEGYDGNRWLVMMGLRKANFSPYAYGWGMCTVNPATVKAFNEVDPRLKASIIDMEGEGVTEAIDMDEFLRDQREYTGYAVKKYTPLCYYDGVSAVPEHASTSAVQEYQYQPFIVLRYADVLLMAAELGGTPSMDAKSCLDAVRDRAGLPHVSVTQDNIMAERHYELAFEAIRYWDLLRQGVNTAANVIAISTTVQTGGSDVNYTVQASNIIAKRGLMQIPQNQITRSNGILKQNAGW